MPQLLLGCGAKSVKRINGETPWTELVRLDINPEHVSPDNPESKAEYVVQNIWFDLEAISEDTDDPSRRLLPWAADHFDEIHAYEVLEHIGDQGDYRKFFAQFTEFYRVLKPGGLFFATVPHWKAMWAWGDPSHRRIINNGTITFLQQSEYRKQVGNTALSDFRYLYKADFSVEYSSENDNLYAFVLKAIDPSTWGQA